VVMCWPSTSASAIQDDLVIPGLLRGEVFHQPPAPNRPVIMALHPRCWRALDRAVPFSTLRIFSAQRESMAWNSGFAAPGPLNHRREVAPRPGKISESDGVPCSEAVGAACPACPPDSKQTPCGGVCFARLCARRFEPGMPGSPLRNHVCAASVGCESNQSPSCWPRDALHERLRFRGCRAWSWSGPSNCGSASFTEMTAGPAPSRHVHRRRGFSSFLLDDLLLGAAYLFTSVVSAARESLFVRFQPS